MTDDPSATGTRTPRTNVLLILTDDQGVWAAGCYGNPDIRTPNLDRLAREGMRFARFFVATPVCSPSRATLLTGRIPSQHGVHDWLRGGNVGPDAAEYLRDEVCYTDVMAAHGWTCGLSGKWHLGASQLQQHGFSHWYVHQSGGGRYNDAPMVRNGELIDEPGYVTDRITDDALAFLEAHARDEAPFYLSVHYTAPHSPWTGHPQDIVDSYDDCPFVSCPQEPRHPWALSLTTSCLGNREMLKGYYAAVTAMDQNVGRLLERLDDLGLSGDTLVVFLSDNGFSCGQHGFWGKGNGTNPRNMYENSIRVPALFRHPGRIPAGSVQPAMVSAYDLMPTLLEYLGLPLPGGVDLVGQSFAGALLGAAAAPRQDVVIYDEYGSTRMIRTERWKYVHRHPDGPHELWDLANDPDERCNLIGDPSQASQVEALRRRLAEWFARYVRPEVDGLSQQVTGLGQLRPVGRQPEDPSPAYFGNPD
jgi:choline-sulfatase